MSEECKHENGWELNGSYLECSTCHKQILFNRPEINDILKNPEDYNFPLPKDEDGETEASKD